MNSFLKTVLRLLFLFILVVVIFHMERAQGQSFKLQGREYRLVDSKWYNFTIGEKGDQIVPERMIVRLRDRGDLRGFDFDQIGLSNIRIISDELFGGYYIIDVRAPQDPFGAANIFSQNRRI